MMQLWNNTKKNITVMIGLKVNTFGLQVIDQHKYN